MPTFGQHSRDCRDECHEKLQRVLNEAIKRYDSSCIWGYRDKEHQDAMFQDGTSQLKWPFSKHNRQPARAFDVIPYPKGYKASDKEFYLQATHILRAAATVGVRIKWGGHWRRFKDLAHFELDNSEL